MALTVDQLNIQIAADSKNATRALTSLIKKLEKLKATMDGSATSNITISNSFNKTTNAVNQATTATNKYNTITNKGSKTTRSFGDNLARQVTKWRTLIGVFKNAANVMGTWFKESNDYIETLNLFNVTMGQGADAANRYAKSVSELMGIDISEWMNYQGTFKQLTSGFGVADKQANVMSQNLTQLSYDLASFFNTDVETAFDKLSSAMSGQVKGLRQFGIDTTVASLQEYALSKGIETKVRNMTQAEKSLLRYNYIMEKSIIIQGDMARTIVTPANALRILNAQLTQMKRALGNVISVIVARFIPYVQALVEIVRDAANSLANLLGFELPKIDYSGLDTGGFADDLEDAEDATNGTADTLKKIKKQLMGFDELNILSNPDSDSGSGADGTGTGGALGGMEPIEYDFLAGLKTNKLDEIKDKLKEIAKWVGLVGAGFAGWKIAANILGLSTAFKGFISSLVSGKGIGLAAKALATTFAKAFGAGLMAMGAAIDIGVIFESWADGVSWDGLVEQLEASGLLHLGGFLLGGTTGMAIGAILDGILTLIPSIKSAVADGNEEWSNTLSIIKGISVIAGGIAVLTGSWIPLAIGGVIALVSVIAIYFDDIVNFLAQIPKKIAEFFSPIAEWINTNVIQPIIEFFAPIFEAIGEVFNYAKGKYLEIKDGVITAVMAIWSKIVEIYNKIKEIFSALWWAFKEYIWNPIVEKVSAFYIAYIKPIVDGVAEAFSKVWAKFKEKIIDPIAQWFADLWKKILDFRDKAVEVFKKIGTAVADFVSGAVKSVINGVLSKIEGVINGFIFMLNGAISLINKIPGVNITKVEALYIPRLAEGGIVNEGQMFIAREAGPELVGSIGRKTAVANNDQIISGIESGVYRAMMAANSNNNGGTQTIRIINEIDGDIVGEKVIQYHNHRVVQTGASPLLI